MKRCRGAALLMCMLMIVVAALLGMSGARIALQDERAGRNDRDRALAFQAAEAALLDAQLDMEQKPDTPRGALFAIAGPRFPVGCGKAGFLRGLCDGKVEDAAWQRIDFTDDTSASAHTAAYGQFTGQAMQAGAGPLQQRLPRYLIESFVDRRAGAAADLVASDRLYRISAVGFGSQDGTRVLLQAWYRRGGAP
nr:PilX N-terminal domain-containing pilus assembly protein [uncultured Noviherbaspirillum sp.]